MDTIRDLIYEIARIKLYYSGLYFDYVPPHVKDPNVERGRRALYDAEELAGKIYNEVAQLRKENERLKQQIQDMRWRQWMEHNKRKWQQTRAIY